MLEHNKKPSFKTEKGNESLNQDRVNKKRAASSAIRNFYNKHIKRPLMYGVLTGGLFIIGDKVFSQNASNLPKLKEGYSWTTENGVSKVVDRSGNDYRGDPKAILFNGSTNTTTENTKNQNNLTAEGYSIRENIVYGPDGKPVVGDTRAIRAKLGKTNTGNIGGTSLNKDTNVGPNPIKVTSYDEIIKHATDKYQLFSIRKLDGTKEVLYAKVNNKGGLKTKPGPNFKDLAE